MQHIAIDPGGSLASAAQAFLVPLNDRQALSLAVEAMIERLDDMAGDSDLEDGHNLEDDFRLVDASGGTFMHYGVGCPIADPDFGADDADMGHGCCDRSYAEWHTLSAATRRAGGIDGKPLASSLSDEDAEEDDPSGQCDEDGVNTKGHLLNHLGAGCPIGDPDFEHDGREEEHDGEHEQMLDDVPVLRVWSLEPDSFTDKRSPLGLSNLMTSFQTNTRTQRSADSGRILRTNAFNLHAPGQPV